MKNRKIKIAFVNVMDGYSGGEIVLKRLIEGLDDEEFEKILYTRQTRMAESVDPARCRIVPIREQYQLKRKRGIAAIFKALGLFFSSAKYLYHMKKEGVDIVHSNSLTSSIYFAAWARLMGLKFVAHNHLVRSGPLYRLLYRYIAWCADEIVCVSEAVRKSWIEAGVSPRKLTVVYSGLPDDFF